jgi:hypothetical protein
LVIFQPAARADDYICLADQTPQAHLSSARSVVWGTLATAERTETWRRGDGGYVYLPELDMTMDFDWALTFRIDRVWKGNPGHLIRVELGRRHESLEVGSKWLLFLDRDAEGRWIADPCSPYRRMSLREAEIELGPFSIDLEATRLDEYRRRLELGEQEVVVPSNE